MITLITGVPGAGKTLYCVHEVLRPLIEQNKLLESQGKEPRRLFVDGIPDLVIPHEIAEDVQNWPDWAPDGALIVVDEVQRVWRPEASTKTPPKSVSELETHRHRGLDFVILTQHPNLMHVNVRKLVGKHIHIRRTSLGVYAYEWSECVNPDTAWKSAISRVKWSHPKSSFGLYKSAEIHNKVKFRIPRPVIFAIGGVCVFIAAGMFLYYRTMERLTPQPQVSHVQGVPPQSTAQQSSNAQQQSDSVKQQIHERVQNLVINDPEVAFRPRFVGHPETAPAYDEIRQVKSMPKLAGFIYDDSRCEAYTEQGTIVEMPYKVCVESALARRYDAYRDIASAGATRDVTPAVTIVTHSDKAS